MRESWHIKKESTLYRLAFHATSLMMMQGSDILPKRMQIASAVHAATKNRVPQRKSSWGSPEADNHDALTRPTSSQFTASRNSSRILTLATRSSKTPTDPVSLIIASMDSSSMIYSAPFCRVFRKENDPTSQYPFNQEDQWVLCNKLGENNYKLYVARNERKQTKEVKKKEVSTTEVNLVVPHKTQGHPWSKKGVILQALMPRFHVTAGDGLCVCASKFRSQNCLCATYNLIYKPVHTGHPPCRVQALTSTFTPGSIITPARTSA